MGALAAYLDAVALNLRLRDDPVGTLAAPK